MALLCYTGREATGGSFSSGPRNWAGESAQGQLKPERDLDTLFSMCPTQDGSVCAVTNLLQGSSENRSRTDMTWTWQPRGLLCPVHESAFLKSASGANITEKGV